MRKIILFAAFALFCTHYTDAQIIIQDYPRSFSCDIDGINDLPQPVVSSSCSVIATKYDDQIFSGGCLGTLVRSFTFSDECGNVDYAEQYILLTDNLEPTIYGAPKDIKVSDKSKIPPAPILASRDNSGQNFEVILSETSDEKKLTRTWTCTDACGNTAIVSQVITFK